ncbi:hypothetical protein DSQ20_07055 [Nitrosarchaeum sp. AC2]|nr:hypothetical protein DSQ20_07055 [Nitrosarchaeum sp. AC2]
MRLMDNRGYAYFAGFHGIPNFWCWHGPQAKDGWPGVRLFLPWHRAYLYRFEKALQDLEPGVVLPWWDWRSANSEQNKIPNAFSETDVDGEPNSLYNYHMRFPEHNIDRETRRFPGKSLRSSDSLPHPDDIEEILDIPDNHFDEFSDSLEDIHGFIHVWTGGQTRQEGKIVSGDMSDIATAAFDPIFWSHHCMIDRLWWEWQKKNGIDEIPDHYREMSLEPFGMTVDETLDIFNLGYDYAGTETTVNGNWSRESNG